MARGGIVDGKPHADLAGWKADLRQLRSLSNQPTAKVYGGRGEFVLLKDAIAQQIAYLERADAIVDAYVREMGSRRSELWDADKQNGHNAAIQAEFVRVFPDYAMPDLIGYSSYGLLQQKLPAK